MQAGAAGVGEAVVLVGRIVVRPVAVSPAAATVIVNCGEAIDLFQNKVFFSRFEIITIVALTAITGSAVVAPVATHTLYRRTVSVWRKSVPRPILPVVGS